MRSKRSLRSAARRQLEGSICWNVGSSNRPPSGSIKKSHSSLSLTWGFAIDRGCTRGVPCWNSNVSSNIHRTHFAPPDGADSPGHEAARLPGRQAQQLIVGGLIAALGARHQRAGMKLLVWGHENGYLSSTSGRRPW